MTTPSTTLHNNQHLTDQDFDMYVYLNSDPGLYTVCFYDPNGKWHPKSDHNEREAAANRVAFMNGITQGERA